MEKYRDLYYVKVVEDGLGNVSTFEVLGENEARDFKGWSKPYPAGDSIRSTDCYLDGPYKTWGAAYEAYASR